MRYLFHLLPDKIQRDALDALRGRVAKVIGQNKALDYPTAHVTLVQGIQDGITDDDQFSLQALRQLLHTFRGIGGIELVAHNSPEYQHHVLMPLMDTPRLQRLRDRIYAGVLAISPSRNGEIQNQTWPHLTLAQDVGEKRAQLAKTLIDSEGGWGFDRFDGTEVAILARDVTSQNHYQIIDQVSLSLAAPSRALA